MTNLLHKHHDNVDPNATGVPAGQGMTNDPNYAAGNQAAYDPNLATQSGAGTGTGMGGMGTGPGMAGVGAHNNHPNAKAAAAGAGVAAAEHHHVQNQGGATHLGNHPTAAAGALAAGAEHHHATHGHNATGAGDTTGTGVGTGTGLGHGHHTDHLAQHDPALMQREANPLYPSPHAPGAGAVGAGAGAVGAGAGTGAGTGGTHSSNITTSSGKSPSTQAFIGKVEHAVGTVLGSESMKAKGIAKEQEAMAVKGQQRELSEAERLEAHAGLARDRANQHAATGAFHSHAKDNAHMQAGYGAAPTQVGEIGQATQGVGGIGGAGAARAI